MRILLGMPCMRTIPQRTVVSLLRLIATREGINPVLVEGSLIYSARDDIARYAVDHNYDYLLFVDSDMVFNPEDFDRLMAHNVGICSGLYVTRAGERKNVAYEKIITRRRFPYREPKLIEDKSTTGFAPVSACGFGFCLIKTSVLKSMFKYYRSLFEPFKGVGEDIAFCIRARRIGYKTFIDRDVKLGHVGEQVYGYDV